MPVPLIIFVAAVLMLSCLFVGATWGIRVGRTEGLAAARALTQENWVDLLEVSVNLQQARSAAVDPLSVQAAPKALQPPTS